MIYKRTEENQSTVHSAAMAEFKGETYLTFYECLREGWTQRVVLLKRNKSGKWEELLKLENGTGNPVLVVNHDKLYLVYTKFKDGTQNIKNVPFLWKHVDMFVGEVKSDPKSYYETGKKLPVKIDANYSMNHVAYFQNLCPRVSGLRFSGDHTLLGCYDETFGMGVAILFTSRLAENGERQFQIVRHSIMHDNSLSIIQPSIYLHGKTIKMEARNFCSGCATYGIGGTWDAKTNNWSCYKADTFFNYHESVARFSYAEKNLRVYGNKQNRTELVLQGAGRPIRLNDEQHGSYPNFLVNSNGTLTVCFTEYNSIMAENSKITLKTFDAGLELEETEYV